MADPNPLWSKSSFGPISEGSSLERRPKPEGVNLVGGAGSASERLLQIAAQAL
jgi:hypothetical protein